MTGNLLVRPMRRDELDALVGWAADEGWNPGLGDAEVFWAADPEGFVAAESGGELASGSPGRRAEPARAQGTPAAGRANRAAS